jgi:hypothetical protein
VLLDIHPEPTNSRIEVVTHGDSVSMGELDESSLIATILAARSAFNGLVERGLFACEREEKFEYLHYFTSVEGWLDEIDNEWEHAEVAPEIVDSVRRLMDAGNAEIVMREPTRAARFRRL